MAGGNCIVKIISIFAFRYFSPLTIYYSPFYYCNCTPRPQHKDESNPNQVSFEESESKITSSATKPTTTTPRRSKKKNGRRYKKKNWDTTNTTDNNAVSIQTYKDYTTNAEGAAILASLGGHNGTTNHHHYGHPSLVYNPESVCDLFPIENNEGPYLDQEYYSGGSQAAAAAASYYYRPNFTAEEIATGTNAAQQQHQMYGMPQYPVYYSYYPITMLDGTMVFYPPTQQCWDENTPPSGENHPSPPPVAGPKTRLNVDAPSFEPKKI